MSLYQLFKHDPPPSHRLVVVLDLDHTLLAQYSPYATTQILYDFALEDEHKKYVCKKKDGNVWKRHIHIRPGLVPFLQQMREYEWEVWVWTHTQAHWAYHILQHVDPTHQYFQGVIGRSLVSTQGHAFPRSEGDPIWRSKIDAPYEAALLQPSPPTWIRLFPLDATQWKRKDLRMFGLPLAQVVLVDDNPDNAFGKDQLFVSIPPLQPNETRDTDLPRVLEELIRLDVRRTSTSSSDPVDLVRGESKTKELDHESKEDISVPL